MKVSIASEAGGHVATCECGWLRWSPAESDARSAGSTHVAKCKGPAEAATQAAPRRAASNWTEREGSTWIDNL